MIGTCLDPRGYTVRTRNLAAAFVLSLSILCATAGAAGAASPWSYSSQFSTGAASLPTGIASSSSGDIHVVDQAANQVDVYDSSGSLQSSFGSDRLNAPTSVAVGGPDGDVYVTDTGNRRVLVFDSAGAFVRQLGDSTVFLHPFGVAVASDGTVYVSDDEANSVEVFDNSGANTGHLDASGTLSGGFGDPAGVAVSSDAVYVADFQGSVFKFPTDGSTPSEFGFGIGASPTDVDIDPDGNVLVADSNTHVTEITPDGTNVDQFGSDHFSGLLPIAVDPAGDLLGADLSQQAVLRFHKDRNHSPGAPGAPSADTTLSKTGSYTVSWGAATDPDAGDSVTYTLQHDDGSGWSTVSGAGGLSATSFAVNEDEGVWSYRVKAVDSHGAESGYTESAGTTKVDKSAPNAPSLTVAAGQTPVSAGGVDWYKDSVTVDVASNGDNPSGAAASGVDPSTLGSFAVTANGTSNLSRTVSDLAGNVSAPGTLTVHVDAADPTVSISGCPTSSVELGSSQSINVSASDGESGLGSDPSGTLSLDTSTVGSHTRTVTAIDNVGHSKSASCTYSVVWPFGGFYSPVNNKPFVNVAKAGSSIPVKFSLGGDRGLGILASGSPTSRVFDPTTTLTPDTIEETLTATPAGLTYDATAQRYQYVWKTDGSWTGYREFVLRLSDGSVHTAYFQFK